MIRGLNTGVARGSTADRGNDLYETPSVAVHALLKAENLPLRLWEPACGPGSIVRILREAGREVFATDLVDYSSEYQDESGRDFLMPFPMPEGIEGIITNPPFKNAEAFVEKAIGISGFVAMLLRLAFLESERRCGILDDAHLARVHVFRNRLPMMHRSGQGAIAPERQTSSALAFAWFVWDRSHEGPTHLHRISW